MELTDFYMGSNDPIEDVPPSSRNDRRPLSQRQLDDFLEAAEERPLLTEPTPREAPKTDPNLLGEAGRRKFFGLMMKKYPMRTRRLIKDLEWFRKQAAKNGLDPADVRWML